VSARFEIDCDGGRCYRVDVVVGRCTIVAAWSRWEPARRRRAHGHPGVEFDGRPLTVSGVVARCAQATVTLDGEELPGRVNQSASPTFVALAESWTPAR
jgi:hypothetical protein